jgi:hypothetical protein
LETGCGATTVIFAAAGTEHIAVSPSAEEHERVRAWCAVNGIDTRNVRFAVGTSDSVLPTLDVDRLDVVLIDGAHAFPHPIVDWQLGGRRLRVGGALLLDDLPIPSVGVLFRYLAADPHWHLEAILDERAAVFRKIAEPPPDDDWLDQPFNRSYPNFSFLPPARRLFRVADAYQHRMRGRLGQRLPALRHVRRRAGL